MSDPSLPSLAGRPVSDRRTVILNAALEAFYRYGYARTSMADIAALAHVPRSGLYEHFRNKEDLFRSLAEAMLNQAQAAAEAAWPPGMPAIEGLGAAALARDLVFFRLLYLSPHSEELLNGPVARVIDIECRMEAPFADLVAARLPGTPDAAAIGRLMLQALQGLKRAAESEESFVHSVQRFARLIAMGIAAESKD